MAKKLIISIGSRRSGKTLEMAEMIARTCRASKIDLRGNIYIPGEFDGSLKDHIAQKRFDAINNNPHEHKKV